mgnify:FL=1
MAEINKSIVKVEDLRITKLRTYLLSIIDVLVTNKKYQINANMLSNEPNNYSLDRIPTPSTEEATEKWITGTKICRDVYSFRSRVGYSQDTIENLITVGCFEIFEKLISSNNEKGILPNIEGIQSIQCLNCGSMNNANTNTAEFDIQIQITYKED